MVFLRKLLFPDSAVTLPLPCPFSNADTMPGAVQSRKFKLEWTRVRTHLHSFLCEKKIILVYSSHWSQALFFLRPKAAVFLCFFPYLLFLKSTNTFSLPNTERKFPSVLMALKEKRIHFFGGLLSCMSEMSPRDWHLGSEWLFRDQSTFMLSEPASCRKTGKSSSSGL